MGAVVVRGEDPEQSSRPGVGSLKWTSGGARGLWIGPEGGSLRAQREERSQGRSQAASGPRQERHQGAVRRDIRF